MRIEKRIDAFLSENRDDIFRVKDNDTLRDTKTGERWTVIDARDEGVLARNATTGASKWFEWHWMDNFVVENINEGVWSVPNTVAKANKLLTIFQRLKAKKGDSFSPLPEADKEMLKDSLYHIVGSDSLFDDIDDSKATIPSIITAIANEIQDMVASYQKNPSTFRDKFDPEAIKILKKIRD